MDVEYEEYELEEYLLVASLSARARRPIGTIPGRGASLTTCLTSLPRLGTPVTSVKMDASDVDIRLASMYMSGTGTRETLLFGFVDEDAPERVDLTSMKA